MSAPRRLSGPMFLALTCIDKNMSTWNRVHGKTITAMVRLKLIEGGNGDYVMTDLGRELMQRRLEQLRKQKHGS